MGLKISKKPATAVIGKQFKDKGNVIAEETNHETLESHPASQTAPSSQLCEVTVDLSFTKNLGNYQSARVGVSLKIPCDHADIDTSFDYAKEWADGKLNLLVTELEGDTAE